MPVEKDFSGFGELNLAEQGAMKRAFGPRRGLMIQLNIA